MKERYLILCAIFVGALATPTFAGVWSDDFEDYANQAALEADDWEAVSGFAHGQLDSTNHYMVSKSMRIQQTPLETRPTRILQDDGGAPSVGRVGLFFYDDGADLKGFDIAVENGANSVALGLRDDQVGTATEYTYRFNSTVANTGIQRSVGWHLAQFSIGASGTEVRIDNQGWTGNVFASLTGGNNITMYTNFGNASDANEVWIDYIVWNSGAEYVGLPATPWLDIPFSEFYTGTEGWAALPGTDTQIDHITNDGYLTLFYQNQCMDLFDELGGKRGVEYDSSSFPGLYAPVNGRYKVEFQHMNGPEWQPAYNPWPLLTVSLDNKGHVNLGSDRQTGWDNPFRSEGDGGPLYVGSAGETDGVWLTGGSDFTCQIQSIADAETQLAFSRWDHFYLVLLELGTEPASATPTPASSVAGYELYE